MSTPQDSQAARYTLLRQRYDASFARLTAQIRRRQELMPGGQPPQTEHPIGRTELDDLAREVRYYRDRIADLLLRTQGSTVCTQSQVQEAAYFLWLNAGCPSGTSASDWTAAQQRMSECQAA